MCVKVMRQAIEAKGTRTNPAGAGAAGAMSSWSGHGTVSSSHQARTGSPDIEKKSGGWVGL